MNEGEQVRDLSIVMPCLDDWFSVENLLNQLDQLGERLGSMTVYVVDDGSRDQPGETLTLCTYNYVHVVVVRLGCNVGHQRALCIGIVEALASAPNSIVVLMDSDGEDSPVDIQHLLRALATGSSGAAVAVRGRRHSGATFRIMNRIFQWVFRVLTGQELNFGNFMALSPSTAMRLVYTGDTWNNIPTSLIRSRAFLSRVPIDRAPRYGGQSRMGFVGLINHGLGAVSVYSDVVFARVIVASSVALGFTGVLGVAALVTRLITGVPLPGWFALATTAVAVGSLVLLVSVTLLTFTMLAARRTPSPPPMVFATEYISEKFSLPVHKSSRDS